MSLYGPQGKHRAYTVGQLIEALQLHHPDTKIYITDPDTGWTCPTMMLWRDDNDTLWIDPCDYPEMIS